MVEIANIREHCSWIHKNMEEATEKAVILARAAIAKVNLDAPLFPGESRVTKRALVIGGGIAGIQTCLLYTSRNECCGGYISLKEKEMSGRMSCNIVDSAAGAGAEMLITACPLCMYNLNKSGSGKIPVYYFTELLAEALGVKEEALK